MNMACLPIPGLLFRLILCVLLALLVADDSCDNQHDDERNQNNSAGFHGKPPLN